MVLSNDQLQSYFDEGYLYPLKALDTDEAMNYLNHSNEIEKLLGGKPKATELTQMHLSFRWAYDLATDPRILDVVESIIGPNILIWATSIFAKQPHSKSFIGWHQDEKYWGLDSNNVVSAWVALSDSNVKNGAMKVIPRTHFLDLLPHDETRSPENMLTRGQVVRYAVDNTNTRHILLKPGEMSLHNIRIIHGSEPNTSDEKRVGFAIRYISTSVRQIGEKPAAILVRGKDEFGNFPLVSPPEQKPNDQAIADHKQAASEFLSKIARSYNVSGQID
jgi:non-haem Fe2+, alpha-ketoglutarate-dependent halogenase